MKENIPDIKESRIKTEAKRAGLTVAIFAVMLSVCFAFGKVLRAVSPPQDKYKMAMKINPGNEKEMPSVDVKLIKQCVDQVLNAAPSVVSKTFYKDCE